MKLENKNVLITGSANRIGKEIALHLSKIGYNIAIHYNTSEKEAKKTLQEVMKNNVNAGIFQSNLSNEKNCKTLFEKAENNIGQISILINNASTFRKNTIENTSSKEIEEDLYINLIAPFILSKCLFKKNQKGKVINISDWKTARTNRFSYGISKAAIFGLTKSLSLSMAPNYQVNEIALGAILPPIDAPNRKTEKINLGPIGRTAKMAEVTGCIEMLIKNDFITGERIFIDGGRHVF
ncbi:MAG: SDR family NAD(P)-dependent oxidoreductase [Chloroflexota bacterium]|nr:SDR family NAD(P)-dependent oxidoreductase [Chloroflexota bacterium]